MPYRKMFLDMFRAYLAERVHAVLPGRYHEVRDISIPDNVKRNLYRKGYSFSADFCLFLGDRVLALWVYCTITDFGMVSVNGPNNSDFDIYLWDEIAKEE